MNRSLCIFLSLLFLTLTVDATSSDQAPKNLVNNADLTKAFSSNDSLKLLMPIYNELEKKGKFVQLVELAPFLEQVAHRANNDTLRQSILANQSFALRTLGRYEEALEVSEYGLSFEGKITGRLALMSTKATALGEMGQVDQAITIFQKIIDICNENGFVRQQAAALNNMALYLRDTGELTEAIKMFEFSVEIGRTEKDTSLIAMGLANIGEILFSLQDYETAKHYLNQSLEISKHQKNIPNMLIPLANLGYVALKENDFNRADSLFSVIFKLSKDIKDPKREMRIKFNYAKSLSEKKEFARAEPLLREVVALAQKYGVPIGQAFAFTELAQLYYFQKNYVRVVSSSSIALKIAEQLSNTELIINNLSLRYQALKEQGILSRAFYDLERLTKLNDSLFSENREQLLAEQRIKLETQQKQFDIEALEAATKVKNAQLKNQRYVVIVLIVISIFIAFLAFSYFLLHRNNKKNNLRLKQLNEELGIQSNKFKEANQDKNKLLSILAHDIRTPLNSTRMLLDYIKTMFTQPEVVEIIRSIEERLHIETSAVDNLLEWATQHQYAIEPELKPQNLFELTQEIVHQQTRIAEIKNITIQNTCTNTYSVIADRNLLSAVLRNIVSNAVKYSHHNTTISVGCEKENEHIVVSIRDEGVGMSKEVQEKLFTNKTKSSVGTSNEVGTGLGLSLSKEFVEKMNGHLRFTSQENNGTTFKIYIPGKVA